MRGTTPDIQIHLAQTWDGLYTPLALRLPPGPGPFPVVLLAYGNGGGGKGWLEDAVANRGHLLDVLVARGYACAWLRYRTEVVGAYGQGVALQRSPGSGGEVFNRAPLEYEDTIAIAEHVKTLDGIDEQRVAFVGVSHGGEMLLKMAAEYHGFTVGVAAEPAAHEFLGVPGDVVRAVKHRGVERGSKELTEDDVEVVRRAIDWHFVQPRVAAVRTPMLVMGRAGDDLQAIFRTTFEVLEAAGKQVEWTTYDHDLHGYIFPVRGPSGAYDVAPQQQAAIAEMLAYLDRYLAAPQVAA